MCRDFYPQNEAMRYARQALKGGATAQTVADGLVERTLKRHTSDNIAVIVLKFPWAFSKKVKGSTNNIGANKAKSKKMFGIF